MAGLGTKSEKRVSRRTNLERLPVRLVMSARTITSKARRSGSGLSIPDSFTAVSRQESGKRRPLVSPRVRVFKSGCSAKNGCVCESSSDNLQSDGKPISRETAGDGSRGLASEVPRISER